MPTIRVTFICLFSLAMAIVGGGCGASAGLDFGANAAGGTPPAPAQQMPVLTIAAPATMPEGGSGTVSPLVCAITLSAASTETVQVTVSTTDGTATAAGGDYTSASAQVTFNPGETSKTFDVTIIGDDSAESDETLTVALSAPVAAGLGIPSSVTVTLIDHATIPAPPGAPLLTSTPPPSVLAGEMYTYLIEVTGTPTPTISVSNAPPWLGFDAATNTLSGIAPPHPDGHGPTASMTVTASNGTPPDATQTFSIYLSNGWEIETIPHTFTRAFVPSLAHDATSAAHIAYWELQSKDLMYATNASGAWAVESVDDRSDLGESPCIAVDASGNPHIGYLLTAGTQLTVKYARKVAGVWSTETVAVAGKRFMHVMQVEGKYVSLALNSSGVPCLAWCAIENPAIPGGTGALKYATNAAGSWNVENVETGLVGFCPSLVVDASNKAHMSYAGWYPAPTGGYAMYLRYATNKSGVWASVTADNDSMIGAFSSLALDASGNAHIASLKFLIGDSDLKYATNESGVWVASTVDAAGDTGYWASIGLDINGKVHIAYNQLFGPFKHADNIAGTWNLQVFDVNGGSSHIAPDASRSLCMAYAAMSGTEIRYARLP